MKKKELRIQLLPGWSWPLDSFNRNREMLISLAEDIYYAAYRAGWPG